MRASKRNGAENRAGKGIREVRKKGFISDAFVFWSSTSLRKAFRWGLVVYARSAVAMAKGITRCKQRGVR